VKGKRVAVCSYAAPSFDRDSGSRRTLDLISFLLEEGASVTFLSAHAANPRNLRYARHLRQLGIPVFELPKDPIDELAAEANFDLALLTFWPVAELFAPIFRTYAPETRIVVDSVDLHFLRDARRFARITGPDLPPFDVDYGTQFVGELNAYAEADLVLTVSGKEAGVLTDFLGDGIPVRSVPDCEELEPSSVPIKQRRGILFIGSFFHTPNIQAAEFLCREVVPRIDAKLLERHPVYVVGDGLNDTVRSFAADNPHIRLVGWVPSVVPYLERTRVSILPLLYGAGTKRKLVQSLMIGAPTVSTGVGIEGLDVKPGRDVLVAEDADSLAAAVSKLLVDDAACEELVAQSREAVLKTHSRSVAKEAFIGALGEALERKPKDKRAASEDKTLFRERMVYQEMQRLRDALCEALHKTVPEGATLAVVNNGSTELLRLDPYTAWPYPPPGPNGAVPEITEEQEDAWRELQEIRARSALSPIDKDVEEARRNLEDLRSRGADFLVIPRCSFEWLREHPHVREFLDSTYPIVLSESGLAMVYSLDVPRVEKPPSRLVAAPPATDEVGPREVQVEVRTPDSDGATGSGAEARLIAFYLPQFHPIPENDRWWGEGFTEWTNVSKAEPLFPGHYQPHIPADLGYYDLRLSDVREAQADMARAHGIHGFCYYHYWFHGKQLLERPFNEVLTLGRPDFPFCLCWANEPWSRRWDGRPHEALQPQSYSPEDDLDHIRWLLPALSDPRAITIEGKPVFIVYQGHDLPEPHRTVDIWRKEVERAGLPGIYLMCVETGWDAGWDATKLGFDAKVLFQPQFSVLDQVPTLFAGPETLKVYDYDGAWRALADPEPVTYRRYPSVCARWDNTPRTGANGLVLHRSTPESYGEWLATTISRVLNEPEDQRLVFLNAWNEWAEGCHLEPDQLYGRGYLEATRRALHLAGEVVAS
jgi:glycosyltransferase involved in cell wall biosynthesis